jgi:alpha/beta superfamily hydrolase
MDNPVVVRAAEVAREAGLATLRFNFRGVGASGGTHDRGEGEQDDVRAALAALRARLPAGRPLGLAGYSFGAWVSSRVAAQEALAALCLIAPPLAMFDLAAFDPGGRAVLLVAGTRDPYCPLAAFDRIAGRLPGAATARIEGADHFFFGALFPMGEAVRAWVRGWAPA